MEAANKPPDPTPLPRDPAAFMDAVYDDLRGVAQRYLRRQPANFTLRPTELVHEACLQIIAHAHPEWTSAAHFRAIATHKLWQVIVDHLKRRYAQKRGGRPPGESPTVTATPVPRAAAASPASERVTIEWRDREVDLLDLAEALADLAAESRRLHDVVMLHWFGGLKHSEVAAQLGISGSTAEKDFRYALAWLRRRLDGGPPDGH